MAGAAVGDADELDLVAEAAPLRRGAAGLDSRRRRGDAEDENAEWLHGSSRVRGRKKSGDFITSGSPRFKTARRSVQATVFQCVAAIGR